MPKNLFLTMKKITTPIAIAAAFSLSLIAFSCRESFLEIAPRASIDQSTLLSKKGIDGQLIGVYSYLNGRANRMASASNWVWGSIAGGDANKGTDPGDFNDINPIQRYEPVPTQGVIWDNWRGRYEGVARANGVLRSIELAKKAGSDLTETDIKNITAETRFLRGHYYFELKRSFNNVPYVDETVDYGTGIEKVANNVDIWPKIEADFKFAYDNLPETQAAVGRANKWAAASYLAKVYMYQKKFAEARVLFDLIIASGKTSDGKKYALVPRYADVFRASNDNHAESIFAIQNAANTGSVNNAMPDFDLNYPYNTGPNGPGNCCGFFQPSFEMANSYRTSAGLPLLDGSYNAAANELKNDQGIKSDQPFTPDAGPLDPRIDHVMGRRGIPYLDWIDHPGNDWIRNQPNGGPYSPKKFAYYRSDRGTLQDNSSWTPGYTAINFPIIRYADVLLMAAEAEVEVGSLVKALEYTNLVRRRAANPAGFVTRAGGTPAANYVISEYPASAFATKDAARQAVRFERKLELSSEGHRFFDLVRWGIAADALNAYMAYESKKLPLPFSNPVPRFVANKNEVWPIPQQEIDLVGREVLKQNPGF